MKPGTPSHVHLIGVGGTAMGALAAMFKERGWRVTGSDGPLYPPMSDQLAAWGIEVTQGFEPAHLEPRPDLVVVGNVCRRDNPEAQVAREAGMTVLSLPGALRKHFLEGKRSLVVAGTHGKTTTTSLLAELLEGAGEDPSVMDGGVMRRWSSNFKLGEGPWFVIEGDEYDSAYFEKSAKFLQYDPHAAIITSLEYDHADIYPDFEAYLDAFIRLVSLVPSQGRLVLWAGINDRKTLLASASAQAVSYSVQGDAEHADWTAVPSGPGKFGLTVRGRDCGEFRTSFHGVHNLRNILAAFIMANEVAGVDLEALRDILPSCRGVKRRQELLGTPGGVFVYDDFGHHPTAVRETLSAIRAAHPTSRLAAAFEPRSATACRRAHQEEYAKSFGAADLAVIAPVGRNLPEEERLDTRQLAMDIQRSGIRAVAARSVDEVLGVLEEWAGEGDVIVMFSNGAFGGLGRRLIEALQ